MDTNWLRNSAVNDIDRLVARIAELEKAVKDTASMGKIHEPKEFTEYPAIPWDVIKTQLPALYEMAIAIKEKNAVLIDENVKTFAATKTFLQNIGLSEQSYVKVGRKYQWVDSAWLVQLRRLIQRTDGWTEWHRQYSEKKKKFDDIELERTRSIEYKEQEARREMKEKQDRFDFTALCIKYERRSDETVEGLRFHLSTLCDYLGLLCAIDYGGYDDYTPLYRKLNLETDAVSYEDIELLANLIFLADYKRLTNLEI